VSGSGAKSEGEAGAPTTAAGGEAIAQREPPQLLGRVAQRLRELERAANGAVAELRREALVAATPPTATPGPGREGGAVLYELITGQVPILVKGLSLKEAMSAIRKVQPLAPSTQNPEITPALDAIVLAALSKNPDGRFVSAGALADELRNWLSA